METAFNQQCPTSDPHAGPPPFHPPLPCGVRFDAEGVVVAWEFPGADPEALLGVTQADLNADPHRFWDRVHPADRVAARETLRTAHTAGVPWHTIVRMTDPRPRRPEWCQIQLAPGPHGGDPWTGWILAIQPQCATLEGAYEISAAQRVKNLFLAQMRREIRGSLNAIVGFTELLEYAGSRKQRQEFVTIINESSGRLLRTVDSLFHYGALREGSHHLEFGCINLHPFLLEILKSFEPRAQTEEVQIELCAGEQMSQRVTGDAAQLRKLVCSLLCNGLHRTREGPVRIDVHAHPIANDGAMEIRISVWDDGDHIPPERVHRLFQPFENTDDSLIRAPQQTGLGLAIASEVCRLHGGTLHYEPAFPHGSRFVATLRLDSCEESRTHWDTELPEKTEE